MVPVQGADGRYLEICYDGKTLVGFLYGKIGPPKHKGFIKVGYGSYHGVLCFARTSP